MSQRVPANEHIIVVTTSDARVKMSKACQQANEATSAGLKIVKPSEKVIGKPLVYENMFKAAIVSVKRDRQNACKGQRKCH